MANTFKNVRYIVTASMATAYTCPASTTALVFLIQAANVDTANRTLEVEWTDDSNGDAVTRLCLDVTVPVNGMIKVNGGALVLEQGDTIQAECDSASKVELTLAVLEMT